MKTIVLLALKDLKKRWALALILACLFGVTFAAFLTLFTYVKSALNMYALLETNWLIVGNSDGLAELHGSRIKPEIRDLLIQKGYTNPIPEIHQIVGTNLVNGTLMRGFNLEEYHLVSPFIILSGRALVPGDEPRLVMIGESLARSRKVKIGDDFLLRGRKFSVIGIFRTGGIQDNEAWINLADAQALLNYGDDVSLYLIPDSGIYKGGELVADGISVTIRGETSGVIGKSLLSFFDFVGVVGTLVGISTALTLANLLWRLAYLRRHEFGVLRALGFGFLRLLVYFFTQCAAIILTGIIGGTVFAVTLLFSRLNDFSAFGFGFNATVKLGTIFSLAGVTILLLGIGVFIPLFSILRQRIPDLLGRN
jgi:ABC-type lipoprotein release transport system permease subunit